MSTLVEPGFRPTLWQRAYWWRSDMAAAWRARQVDAALTYGESLGDNLLCTAVLRELRRRGSERWGMVTAFPELFHRNPHLAAILDPDVAANGAFARIGKRLLRPDYSERTEDPDRDRPPTQHIVAAMCASVGVTGTIELQPELHLSDAELARGARATGHVVLQSSGAGARFRMLNKEWPAQRFEQVAAALRPSFPLLQLGTVDDPPLAHATDLRGRTQLRAAAALLAQSAFFIGTPGFLMHLARAVGCPSIIIYGGRERPEQSGYAGNVNLATDPPCSPCWRRNGCEHGRVCLDQIQVADVLASIEAVVTRRPLPPESVIVQ